MYYLTNWNYWGNKVTLSSGNVESVNLPTYSCRTHLEHYQEGASLARNPPLSGHPIKIKVGLNLTFAQHNIKRDPANTTESLAMSMVPEVGIEPTWSCPRGILSPVRLPVSPLRQSDLLFPVPNFYNNNKKITISTVSGFSVPKESKKSIYFDPYRHISGTIKRRCNYTCKCAIRNNFLQSQHTT